MKVTVTALEFDEQGEVLQRREEGVKDLEEIFEMFETSDEKRAEIESELTTGKTYRYFDDEGTFVCSDFALELKSID